MAYLPPPGRTFAQRLRDLPRFNVIVALASVVITAAMIASFFLEARFRKVRVQPTIIFAESWDANRPASVTVAEQRRDETLRQRYIAEFELQRAEALLLRAPREGDGRQAALDRLAARKADVTRRTAEADAARAEAERIVGDWRRSLAQAPAQ